MAIVATLSLCFFGVSLHGQAGKGKAKAKATGKHPHIHKAIEHLKKAKEQLEKANSTGIYAGHRSQAHKDVEHALHQAHKGIEAANAKGK
jgi:fatty acid-binding protein DegV